MATGQSFAAKQKKLLEIQSELPSRRIMVTLRFVRFHLDYVFNTFHNTREEQG